MERAQNQNEKITQILSRRSIYSKTLRLLNARATAKLDQEYRLEFTFNTVVLSGNVLSFEQVEYIDVEKMLVHGESLKETLEVANSFTAIDYITDNAPIYSLDEKIILKLSTMLTRRITVGGKYRTTPKEKGVMGTNYPVGGVMQVELQKFYRVLARNRHDPITLAAWTHCEIMRIKPFEDGNGRLARLLMNYQLIYNGLPPIVIDIDDWDFYEEVQDAYDKRGDIKPMSNFIAELVIQRMSDIIGDISQSIKNERNS